GAENCWLTRDSKLDKLKEVDGWMDVSAPVDQRSITAEPGETVTLPCRVPLPVKVLQWHRSNRTEYVLSFCNEQFDPEDQDPTFVNWVDLKDRKMTDGDASLIIKNITTSDAGVYECRAIRSTANRRRREIPVIGIVHLDITRSGEFVDLWMRVEDVS
uniref:Ig-like domain-containing protein n=1 Tax=Amphilophus citrinellus TaxID=61819 RepID=A0A3Q0SBL0_AMPCI